MKRAIAVIAAVIVAGAGIALWAALGRGEGGARATPPSPLAQFSVQGRVLSLTPDPGSGLGSLLVKGTPLGTSGVDYASVRVTPDTRILRQAGDQTEPATFADLAIGQTVKVALVGPVAESYPVQGTAGVIVIVGQAAGGP
jgi:hypothetical protein